MPIFTVFPHFGGGSAGGGGGTAGKNTQKPNHYWCGLVLKFLATFVHRVLSNTHLCQFFTVFPHFSGGSAGGGGGTAEKNTRKPNHNRYGLLLKFSAKSAHRVLSNTHLCHFFTVFSLFCRRFRRRRRWNRQKKYTKTQPLSVWTCVKIFSHICPQGFE